MTSYIFLDTLRFFAHHGVGEQETVVGNEFTVSLRLQVDIRRAAETDDVADDFPQIEEITLKLAKRNPPMGADIEAAGVEICQRRGE